MNVVLDTNIYCADYRLRGGAFQIFWEAQTRIPIQLYVPEVVQDEIIGSFRRHLAEAAQSLNKVERAWSRLVDLPTFKTPAAGDLDQYTSRYKGYLNGKFQERNAKTLSYPDVSHHELVQRAIDRRKPFSENGSGFRDALIWMSVVALQAEVCDTVVFVTKNSKDFGKSGTLHSDLLYDLKNERAIRLYNSLEEFNSECVVPQLEQLNSVLRELQDNTYPHFSLRAWIESNMLDQINEDEAAFIFTELEPDHGHVRLANLQECGIIIVDDVRLLPSGDLLILANADLEVEVCISAKCDDCMHYEDIRRFFGGDCSGDPTAWYDTSGNVAFTLAVEASTYCVEWCEIDEVRAGYTLAINPHPRRAV